MSVKYPNAVATLVGADGNAFSIMSIVKKALRKEGVSMAEQTEFMEEAMSGNYDHLLQTAMKWVTVN